MALDALAEFILRPLLEIAFYAAGYLTGYVVVPLVTLGRVVVGPDRKGKRAANKGNQGTYLVRRPDGTFVMDVELGTYCGIVFWAVVLAGFSIYHFLSC
jgi:hypothetical protein